ncbi:MATE family efflux transporter [Bacillus kwashiorkori]|uniref:MATE family efflux transporter n=1 Tax=Bacillus kwashiorkori TaxID=1522318 RepID=UPI000AA18382|nr:MATE family efflux transporter [Bacillus kwashiorkori]
MREATLESNHFFKRMLVLAIPIAIQTLLTSSLNMVDSIMVGQLGVDSIAAVGVGNKITTILILVLQGFGTGAAIFVSQYWGKKDLQGIRKILLLTLNIVTVFSILFTALILIFTNTIISIFTNDSGVIQISAGYLRIVSLSYLVTAFTIVFSTVLRSMGEVKLPLYISILAIGMNTGLNYLWIFGKFGFAEMGVDGAALATLIARIVQAVLLFLLVSKSLSLSIRKLRINEMLDVSLVRRYFSITIPSIINHAAWTLGETSYFWVYAQMGTNELAAVTLVDPLLFLFMALFIGLSDASQVMIGNSIGAHKTDLAFADAKRFLALTAGLSVVAGIFIVLVTPYFLSIYNINDEVEWFAKSVLIVYAFLVIGKMLNMVNNIGVLRAGGDTKFVLYIDMIGVWAIGLPLAIMGAFNLHLPIFVVYGLANSHEYIRAFLGIKRTLSHKWIRNVTIDIDKKESVS